MFHKLLTDLYLFKIHDVIYLLSCWRLQLEYIKSNMWPDLIDLSVESKIHGSTVQCCEHFLLPFYCLQFHILIANNNNGDKNNNHHLGENRQTAINCNKQNKQQMLAR